LEKEATDLNIFIIAGERGCLVVDELSITSVADINDAGDPIWKRVSPLIHSIPSCMPIVIGCGLKGASTT